jgi:hypothetical protein
MSPIRLFLGLILVATACPAAAQFAIPDSVSLGQDVSVKVWPPAIRTYGMVWVPNALYSTQQGVGLGGETVKLFRLDPDERSLTSSAGLKFMATTRGQWRLNLNSDLYWNQGRSYAQGRIDYDSLARPFYGLGPASNERDKEFYKPYATIAALEATYRLGAVLSLGPRVELHHQAIKHTQEGGLLESGTVAGSAPGTLLGLGVALIHDTRTDRYYPDQGIDAQLAVMDFEHLDGDTYGFWWLELDVRHYRRVGEDQVLAGQFYANAVDGEAPFWRLPSLGYREHSWAYDRDRYLDKLLLAGQAQWRWRPFLRWGFSVSSGVATVASSPGRLQGKYLRPYVGVGARLFVERDGKLVPIRGDLGVGHRNWRVTVGIGELF